MLSYCQLLSKAGNWISCECVFTVVYDVLVAATTAYKRTVKSEGRQSNLNVFMAELQSLSNYGDL